MTYSLLKVEAGDYLGLTPAQDVYRLTQRGGGWCVLVPLDQRDPLLVRRDQKGDAVAVDTHPVRVRQVAWGVGAEGFRTRREAKTWAEDQRVRRLADGERPMIMAVAGFLWGAAEAIGRALAPSRLVGTAAEFDAGRKFWSHP